MRDILRKSPHLPRLSLSTPVDAGPDRGLHTLRSAEGPGAEGGPEGAGGRQSGPSVPGGKKKGKEKKKKKTLSCLFFHLKPVNVTLKQA